MARERVLLHPGDGPRSWWIAAAAALAALGLPPSARNLAHVAAAEQVATVGDIVLSSDDLDRAERRLGFSGALDGVPTDRRRAVVLRRLVEETLLAAETTARGIEVDEAAIDDRMADLVQGLAARNQSLDRMFAATGLDRDGLRSQMRREIATQLLLSQLVTPDEIRAVYDARHREFDGTRYRVSHLVLRPDGTGGTGALVAEARRIGAAIESGEISFAAAAARHSAGPSRYKGGDIGFIPRHGLLAEEFSRAAFELEKGEISEPVVSPFGVHLITVTETDPGTAGPERVLPAIERIAVESVLARLLDECRERTPVVLAPGFEIEPPRQPESDR